MLLAMIPSLPGMILAFFILLSAQCSERQRYFTFEDLSLSTCRFIGQFLLLFFLHQTSLALFRVMASLGRNMIVANTFGSFALLVVMILGGFIITKGWTSPYLIIDSSSFFWATIDSSSKIMYLAVLRLCIEHATAPLLDTQQKAYHPGGFGVTGYLL
jgi:hypothetical protein